jgi:hypothetical protein
MVVVGLFSNGINNRLARRISVAADLLGDGESWKIK